MRAYAHTRHIATYVPDERKESQLNKIKRLRHALPLQGMAAGPMRGVTIGKMHLPGAAHAIARRPLEEARQPMHSQ